MAPRCTARSRLIDRLHNCRPSSDDAYSRVSLKRSVKSRNSTMADELVLYTNPMSRGRVARWMLEEVGQPYKTEVLDYASTMKAPAYVAINPMGKVPALRHGDAVVTETAAICAYLADAFPQAGLAPPPGDRLRAPYYRWLFFAAGPVEAAVSNKALGFVGAAGARADDGLRQPRPSAQHAGSGGVARRLSGRRQLYRRRPLCRLAHRLRHDVRHVGEASRIRAILATHQQPAGLPARQGTRRCAKRRSRRRRRLSFSRAASAAAPTRMVAPSRTLSHNEKPSGAKTIIVDPCWNQPSSSPLRTSLSQAMTFRPR